MQEKKPRRSLLIEDDFKLDLHSVLRDVARQWLEILMLTAAAVMIVYVLLSASARPSYMATAAVAAYNANEPANVNSVRVKDTYTAIHTAQEGAHYLNDILSQGEFRTLVSEELGESFRGSISSDIARHGNLISISVTSVSPKAALKETDAVLHCLAESGKTIMGGMKTVVVREPWLQSGPISPYNSGKLAVAAGIMVFLITCTLLAWYSSTKYTVRNSKEVMPKLGVELLGVIPEIKGKKEVSGLLLTDPAVDSGFEESVRSLAIRLMNEMEKKHCRTLLITGSADGEGKSTLAANIVLAISDMNRKAVLVDMGSFTSDPDLDKCAKNVDFVIVDAKSNAVASETVELASMTDASILVVRENYALVKDIDSAAEVLRNTGNLLGCVFNRARANMAAADAAEQKSGGRYVG